MRDDGGPRCPAAGAVHSEARAPAPLSTGPQLRPSLTPSLQLQSPPPVFYCGSLSRPHTSFQSLGVAADSSQHPASRTEPRRIRHHRDHFASHSSQPSSKPSSHHLEPPVKYFLSDLSYRPCSTLPAPSAAPVTSISRARSPQALPLHRSAPANPAHHLPSPPPENNAQHEQQSSAGSKPQNVFNGHGEDVVFPTANGTSGAHNGTRSLGHWT